MRKSLFFAGGLGMEIDQRRVAPFPERAGAELAVDAGERIVHRVDEHAPLKVDDEHAGAVAGFEQIGAASGRAFRKIGGPDQARLALDEDERFALVERMVAERHRIRAGGDEIVANGFGDAKPARGILAVDDDEIERPAFSQFRQALKQRDAPRPADDVADEQHAHQGAARDGDEFALGKDEIEAFVVRAARYAGASR